MRQMVSCVMLFAALFLGPFSFPVGILLIVCAAAALPRGGRG